LLKFHSTGQAIKAKKQQRNLAVNIILVAIASSILHASAVEE
jgi:hypothetical protein